MCNDCTEEPASGPSRRNMLLGTAGLIGSAFLPLAAQAQSAPGVGASEVPKTANFVLKGGIVLTIDPAIGDFYEADVHVRNGTIVAVGPDVDAPGAEVIDAKGMILMPGMAETHWHVWNHLFKNLVSPQINYVGLKKAIGPQHRPEDFYNATRLAMVEAIDAGITTVINYAHNTASPAHVDAEIRAMGESGLRGRYSYGGADGTPSDQLMDIDDALRANREWFGTDSDWAGRIDFGFSVRAGGLPDEYRKEFLAARDNGLSMLLHGGQSERAYARASAAKLHKEGLIDRSTIFVHSLLFNDEDRAALAETGAANSISIGNEFAHDQRSAKADVRQQMMLQMHQGVNVCLSHDASALNPISMFEQMRMCFAVLSGTEGTRTADFPRVTPTECLEMATINGAKALGFEKVSGTITPGKRADIVMLRATDLNMVPLGRLHKSVVHSAGNRNVDTVIVDGRFLKRGGRILTVDVEEVQRKASASLHSIMSRSGGEFAEMAEKLPRL